MITTIVFDFGNVLINLDFDRCLRNFKELLNVDWRGQKLPDPILGAILQYDKGLISNESFVSNFQDIAPQVGYDQIKSAWNSLIDTIPASRFDFLNRLSENYRLVLLSNINAFHLERVHEILQNEYGIHDFERRYFDHVFYSHLIGKRKPEPDIYTFVESEIHCAPSQILFIDDMEKNIEAARLQGWHGQVHDPLNDIESKLGDYLSQVSN